jgi:hypothetical protein
MLHAAVVGFTLWLDVRGKPCADDVDVLLDLYGGVRTRFSKAGLPPPSGAAVAGVLHEQADLEDDSGDDGELNLLEIGSGGALRDRERRLVGLALHATSSAKEKVAQTNAVHAAGARGSPIERARSML